MGGAFIISRDIFENPIWQNNIEFRLFFLILGKAVWKEEGVKVGDMIIQKGQWLRSYRNLQSDMEYAESNTIRKPGKATIQRAIARLIKEERITIKTVKSGTLFTVINYCKYQDFSHYKKGTRDTSKDSNGTATGQQRDKKKKDNKDNQDNHKEIYTPEFEKWYSEYPRSKAKRDSFTNFERVRKSKGIELIQKCTKNYIKHYNSLSERDKEFSYSSNNFFGQKAYYEEFEKDIQEKTNLNAMIITPEQQEIYSKPYIRRPRSE